MDVLTVCSLSLKWGSRRQQSVFFAYQCSCRSILTGHYRMQKRFVGVSCRPIRSYVNLSWHRSNIIYIEWQSQLFATFATTGMQLVSNGRWIRARLQVCIFRYITLCSQSSRKKRTSAVLLICFIFFIFYFYFCVF